MAIHVESSVFSEGGQIPSRYTCDGRDISPPLSWSGVPEGTKSLALICDDPDAPGKTWVHWVVFNLPPRTTELPEGAPVFLAGAIASFLCAIALMIYGVWFYRKMKRLGIIT